MPEYAIMGGEWLERTSSLSWDGEKFRDHALPHGDEFEPAEASTCDAQYLARLCGAPEAVGDSAWWEEIKGRGRNGRNTFYDKLLPSNILFGLMYRWHLLTAEGNLSAAKEEIVETCGLMASTTGTLWEHVDVRASCNHGCLGYIALLLLCPEKAAPLPGGKRLNPQKQQEG